MRSAAHPDPSPIARPAPADAALLDLRFAALLPAEDWASLDPAVRRRFSRRLSDGATAVYVGEATTTTTTLAGRLLTWAARLIGGPFARLERTATPSVVMVTEEHGGGVQIWTRLYARPRGAPQTVCSAKRFAGPTGLEEHVGRGVGMALRVAVEGGVLSFRSDHYFIRFARLRLRLPRWAEPGRLLVTHEEMGCGRFAFTLDLHHPALGRLIGQRAVYRESAP